jgi:hypothetical protein
MGWGRKAGTERSEEVQRFSQQSRRLPTESSN